MIPSDAVVVCIKRVMKANVYWYRKQSFCIVQLLFPVPVDVRFHHPFNTDYYRVGWDHFVSGTLLNHLNVGLNRILNSSVSTSADGTDWPVKLGISGAHGPIFPQINFNGGAQGLSNRSAE